jgi:hypothetical protein
MVEVEAEEETRHAMAMKILRRRENRRRPIKNGAASNRAQLGRTEDTRKDMKEAGNEHFGKDFILHREKGNRTQLDDRTFGSNRTTPRLRDTERRPETNMEDRAARR